MPRSRQRLSRQRRAGRWAVLTLALVVWGQGSAAGGGPPNPWDVETIWTGAKTWLWSQGVCGKAAFVVVSLLVAVVLNAEKVNVVVEKWLIPACRWLLRRLRHRPPVGSPASQGPLPPDPDSSPSPPLPGQVFIAADPSAPDGGSPRVNLAGAPARPAPAVACTIAPAPQGVGVLGREEELADLANRLGEPGNNRRLVVHGPPGVGKSELLREVGRRLEARYTGGATGWIAGSGWRRSWSGWGANSGPSCRGRGPWRSGPPWWWRGWRRRRCCCSSTTPARRRRWSPSCPPMASATCW